MTKFYSPTTGGFYDDALRAAYDDAGTWPADAVELSDDDAATLLRGQHSEGMTISIDGGVPVLVDRPAPTVKELTAANVAAISVAMEDAAKAKGYDSMLSAISYAQQPAGAPFQAEGAAFLAWRSAVWQAAFSVLAEVEAGTRALPTPAEAVAAMPALNLP